MCNFYFLRYVCGHYTPHYYSLDPKQFIITCGRRRRDHNFNCAMRRIYTNQDDDCIECQRKLKRQIQRTKKEAEKMWSMPDSVLKHYQPSEPWLQGPRFPYPIPKIVVSHAPNMAPEPEPVRQKGKLKPPQKCYQERRRKLQRKIWGEKMFNVVLNLEEILGLLSPKAVIAAAAAAEAEAKRMMPNRPAPPIPDFALSLPCNREHDRSVKRKKWSGRVQASVERRFHHALVS